MIDIGELVQALSADSLLKDLIASINSAETSKRHFREIAQISGLIFTRLPQVEMDSTSSSLEWNNL